MSTGRMQWRWTQQAGGAGDIMASHGSTDTFPQIVWATLLISRREKHQVLDRQGQFPIGRKEAEDAAGAEEKRGRGRGNSRIRADRHQPSPPCLGTAMAHGPAGRLRFRGCRSGGWRPAWRRPALPAVLPGRCRQPKAAAGRCACESRCNRASSRVQPGAPSNRVPA